MGRPQFLTFGIEKTGMESDGMFVQGPEQACRVETLAEAAGRDEGEAKPCSERNVSPWRRGCEVHLCGENKFHQSLSGNTWALTWSRDRLPFFWRILSWVAFWMDLRIQKKRFSGENREFSICSTVLRVS